MKTLLILISTLFLAACNSDDVAQSLAASNDEKSGSPALPRIPNTDEVPSSNEDRLAFFENHFKAYAQYLLDDTEHRIDPCTDVMYIPNNVLNTHNWRGTINGISMSDFYPTGDTADCTSGHALDDRDEVEYLVEYGVDMRSFTFIMLAHDTSHLTFTETFTNKHGVYHAGYVDGNIEVFYERRDANNSDEYYDRVGFRQSGDFDGLYNIITSSIHYQWPGIVHRINNKNLSIEGANVYEWLDGADTGSTGAIPEIRLSSYKMVVPRDTDGIPAFALFSRNLSDTEIGLTECYFLYMTSFRDGSDTWNALNNDLCDFEDFIANVE